MGGARNRETQICDHVITRRRQIWPYVIRVSLDRTRRHRVYDGSRNNRTGAHTRGLERDWGGDNGETKIEIGKPE